jgi:hypothetical protein
VVKPQQNLVPSGFILLCKPGGIQYAFCLSSGGRMHFFFRKAGDALLGTFACTHKRALVSLGMITATVLVSSQQSYDALSGTSEAAEELEVVRWSRIGLARTGSNGIGPIFLASPRAWHCRGTRPIQPEFRSTGLKSGGKGDRS